jgi:Protein of unknown function (DUF2721)
MPTQGLLVEELSRTISEATAPAFLIGAVAAFLSVLIGRYNRIADRYIALAADKHNGPLTGHLEASVSSLRRRAKLLIRAIKCAIIAAISVIFLVITAFASAAVGLNQVYGAALLFVLAFGFLAASLICLWFEVRLAERDRDMD